MLLKVEHHFQDRSSQAHRLRIIHFSDAAMESIIAQQAGHAICFQGLLFNVQVLCWHPVNVAVMLLLAIMPATLQLCSTCAAGTLHTQGAFLINICSGLRIWQQLDPPQ